MYRLLHTTRSKYIENILKTNILVTNKPKLLGTEGVYCRPIFREYKKIETERYERYGNIHILLNPVLLNRFDWTAHSYENDGNKHIYNQRNLNEYLIHWEENLYGEICFAGPIYDLQGMVKRFYFANTLHNMNIYSSMNDVIRKKIEFYDYKEVIDV